MESAIGVPWIWLRVGDVPLASSGPMLRQLPTTVCRLKARQARPFHQQAVGLPVRWHSWMAADVKPLPADSLA